MVAHPILIYGLKIEADFSGFLTIERMSDRYVPPPPHKIPEAAAPYIAALSEQQHALHLLATDLLGSSYFVETSHGFIKWQEDQAKLLTPQVKLKGSAS